MRRTWISLATVVATLLALTPQMASAQAPTPPGPTTGAWSVKFGSGAKTSEGMDGADKMTAQQCWGNFANILREYNGSRYYLHFGGTQQCSPNPMSQDLQIFIYRWDPTAGWEFADNAHAASGGAHLITAWGEPFCLNQNSTQYYMKAWGTAGGVHLSPYPSVSQTWILNCDIG